MLERAFLERAHRDLHAARRAPDRVPEHGVASDLVEVDDRATAVGIDGQKPAIARVCGIVPGGAVGEDLPGVEEVD